MSFHIGQEVECIDDAWRVSRRKNGWFERFRSFKPLAHNLTKGEVYTVAGLTRLYCSKHSAFIDCIFVSEGRHLFGHGNIPFPEFQFRAIVKRKTDISIFTEIARKASKKQGADA